MKHSFKMILYYMLDNSWWEIIHYYVFIFVLCVNFNIEIFQRE